MLARLKEFIKESGGYKVFIFGNISILVLIIAVVLIQQKWIMKERRALESVIKSNKEPKRSKRGISASDIDGPKDVKIVVGPTEMPGNGKGLAISFKYLKNKKTRDANVKKIIKEAGMFYEFEQYDKAIIIYKKLSKIDFAYDDSDKVLNRLADCYYHLEEFKNALVEYKKVFNDYVNSPYSLDAQLGIGKSHIQIGNYSEGRRVLYSLAGLESKYKKPEEKLKLIDAHYTIADSYIEQAKKYVNDTDRQTIDSELLYDE